MLDSVIASALGAIPANAQPVKFDKAAARAAAQASTRAARVVGQAAAERAGDTGAALVDWSGPQRQQFESSERGLAGDARALEAELRDTACKVEDAIEAVEAENRRRARRLDEWMEDRREALAEKAEP